ncbi:hypothetical protein SAMN05216304_105158 [Bosea sp. OK403]|nr:hypothetical protein SAMN05216304_105158 [Bosea sp. OK403]
MTKEDVASSPATALAAVCVSPGRAFATLFPKTAPDPALRPARLNLLS